jgi:hypothetical protein
MQELQKDVDSMKAGAIILDQLDDQDMKEQMKKFDIDNDGKLEAFEILAALKESHARGKFLMYAIVGLVLALIVSYVTLGGLVYFVIQLSKESSIAPTGMMLIKGTDQIVQVGSADFTVQNGVFHTRAQEKCSGGTCSSSEPIKTSQVSPREGIFRLKYPVLF